jgi:hypothetical protein
MPRTMAVRLVAHVQNRLFWPPGRSFAFLIAAMPCSLASAGVLAAVAH